MSLELFSSSLEFSQLVRTTGAALVVISGVTAAVCYARWQRQQVRRQAELQAKRQETSRRQNQMAKVRTVSAQVPLESLIDFSFEGDSELSASAREAIAVRPELVAELSQMLYSDERVRALKYLWLYMPQCPMSLASAFHDCVSTLPSWSQQRFPSGGLAHSTEFEWACRAIPRLAERLAPAGVDFVAPIRQLSDFIRAKHGPDAMHYLVLLEGVGAAETQRKPRLGTMLWENARGLSKSPMAPISFAGTRTVRPTRMAMNAAA